MPTIAESQMLEVLADTKTLRVLIEACEYLKIRTVGADVSRLAEIINAAKFLTDEVAA
jgi:hypothetical protein